MADAVVMSPRSEDDASSRGAERALMAAARALSAQLTIEGACMAALEAVQQVFGATSSWIMLHDRNSATLRTVWFRGVGSEVYRGSRIPVDENVIASEVFTQQQRLFVPDVLSERRWFDAPRMHRSGLRSLFMLPLVAGRQSLGVLAIDAPQFTAETPPSPRDVEHLDALAAQAAIAVTNASLFEASQQDRQRLRDLVGEQHPGDWTGRDRTAGPGLADGAVVLGQSTAFLEALTQAELVAAADTTVLLLGETGTGKDLIARLIHERSRRASQPFIAVNCAALPEHLIESELFGHERGAFTGAMARKAGSFEIANRGTIFLDEIGDLAPEAQAKLLRVLQDRQVQRIGAPGPIAVDVRVIAATNQDLEAAIARKRFRPDLFYRLSVFPVRTPALRERLEDIPLLASHFLRLYAGKLGKPAPELTPAALDRLRGYRWPGNIRELQNVIERAVILTSDVVLDADAITLAATPSPDPPSARSPKGRVLPPVPGPGEVSTLADAERRAILDALDATGWRISGRDGAAERLGLKPTTLHAKMKKLGIRRPTPAAAPRRRGLDPG